MDRYIIEYRDIARGDWSCDLMQAPTPHSKSNAAHTLEFLREQTGNGYEFRVTLLDHLEGTFADVTLSVEMAIEERAERLNREALEDDAHERQERLSWVTA